MPRNDDDEEDSSMGDYGKEDTEQTEQDEERVSVSFVVRVMMTACHSARVLGVGTRRLDDSVYSILTDKNI